MTDSTRALQKRQTAWTDEDRAQVRALQRQGLGAVNISAQTGVPARTVSHWMARWRDVAIEEGDRELLQRDYRLALRTDEIIHDGLDFIAADESGERAAKSLIALNAIRNTPVDKILKRQGYGSQQQANVQVFIGIKTDA